MRFIFVLLLLIGMRLTAQDNGHVIILHDTVGTSIDSIEKAKYHLFSFWSAKQFDHAEFLMNADSTISIRGTMKDGAIYIIPCTKKEFDKYNYQVRYYAGLIPGDKNKNRAAGIGSAIAGLSSSVFAFISYKRTHR